MITEKMLVVFAILAVAVGLFAWGKPRADIVGLLVALGLMCTGILTPGEALAGFGSPVVILIAAVFIVGEALVNTGVAQRLGDAVVRIGKGNETKLVSLIMLLAGLIGSVMSSSALAAMLIPVVLRVANKTGLNRKRLLMPLCVAVTISGMMTLIASSSNIIIEDILRGRKLTPLGFFSWAPIGVVILVISIFFMLWIGRDLLSKKLTAEEGEVKAPNTRDLLSSYDLEKRWYRMGVLPDSPLVGRAVAQVRKNLYQEFGVILVGVEKHLNGKSLFLPAKPEITFEAEDAIFTVIDAERVGDFTASEGCSISPPLDERSHQEALQQMGVAEVMLAPESKLVGNTLGEIVRKSFYGVVILGIRRRGQRITKELAEETLDFGDTLLVVGDWSDIMKLRDDRENFVLLTLPAEYEERLPARAKAPIAVGILVAMVTIMVFQALPNSAAALVAALAMLAAGCVRVDSIYRVISWTTLVLIAGTLPLATALTKTGATTLMAGALVKGLGHLGPTVMLGIIFLVTAVVGLFISNSATAVLIAPIAIEAAQALNASPQAFAMTVAIACSAAYVTPVSSTTNMLVMEPGNYVFGDYVKVGLPMLFLSMLATIALVRVLYPF
ncbi:MAG: hypothetical protein N5P05_002046 [Chroococcopsis gigantea SAG 12.99]|jgi:di/tricarboxylate transporter|nr:SLC13 family permease [Chlorogloea purpurea SAG 13.99]MDV3000440.1 hypothetical protein [Chroococcopsis gigantea SAG 12.99]